MSALREFEHPNLPQMNASWDLGRDSRGQIYPCERTIATIFSKSAAGPPEAVPLQPAPACNRLSFTHRRKSIPEAHRERMETTRPASCPSWGEHPGRDDCCFKGP